MRGHWTDDRHRRWQFPSKPVDAEEARDEALNFIRADYYTEVTRVAEDLMERARDGEFESADDMDQAIHETIDGHRRVFITHLAKLGLVASDNESYADEEGLEPTGPEQRMFWAMRQDVYERMDADGFDPYDEDSWLDEDDDY